MKTIIAGVRRINYENEEPRYLIENDVLKIFENLNEYHKAYPITEVVSGGAYGVDKTGELWAKTKKIPVKVFPYKSEFGKAGGMIRNKEMAEYADRAICFWDHISKGTKNMIETMEKLNKPVTVWKLDYYDVYDDKLLDLISNKK
jgi:hypothetical protein